MFVFPLTDLLFLISPVSSLCSVHNVNTLYFCSIMPQLLRAAIPFLMLYSYVFHSVALLCPG